jgi:hypothetical protein
MRTVGEREVEESLDREITKADVRFALGRMKLNRAVGPDDIPTEILRIIANPSYDTEFGTAAFDLLMLIVNKIHNEGVVPAEYKDTILVNLFKKGDPTDTNNYRGIALMSHIGKLIAKVYAIRLDVYVEDSKDILPEEQCGFRRGRSTTDMMLVSRFLTEQANLSGVDMFQIFVDLTKAYDSVDRSLLWMILERIGVPPKMRKAITNMHQGMRASVRVEGKLSDSFEMVHGLRQGCVLAPLLFNIFFAFVVKHARESLNDRFGEDEFGVQIQYLEGSTIFDSKKHKRIAKSKGTNAWIALFADDAAMMTTNEAELQPMMDAFHSAATAFGLTISIKKTEVLAKKANVKVIVEGQTLKVVKKFKYLGGIQVPDGSSGAEIRKRISNARASFRRYKGMFRSKAFTWEDKANLYEAHVLSVLLYASGTWTVTARDWEMLETMHLSHLLTMCGKTRLDKISYAKLLRRFNMKSNIEGRVRDCRLRLFQRIMNLPLDRLPRIVAYSVLKTHASRRIGNKSQWKKGLWDDTCKFGYARPGDTKTSVKGVVQPLWSEKIRKAGTRELVSLPGTTDSWIWNPTIREQRDDVFMESYWKCEAAKSQKRQRKRLGCAWLAWKASVSRTRELRSVGPATLDPPPPSACIRPDPNMPKGPMTKPN